MKIPEYSVHHRAVTFFVTLVLLIGGIYAYDRLGRLEDPEFVIKTAVIITPYPGASPHEVEQLVTDVVEKAAQSSDEVEKIRSVSRAGLSTVYVDLYDRNRKKRIQQLWDMLRRKIGDCQRLLPPGAGPSVVYDDYSDVYGIFLALTGDGFSNAELKDYADFIKRELLLVDDVARIQLFGIQTQCINVDIARSKIDSLGIPPGRIMAILKRQNEMLESGALENRTRRIRMAVSGAFTSLDEIKRLVVEGEKGEQFLLKDLATITRGYVEPPEPMMRFNGRSAVGISISTAPGGNVVTMGDAVQKRIDELMRRLPLGIRLDGVYYQSKLVKKAIGQFIVNLIESVSIVIFVLLVTMGIRGGMIVGSGLLLSIFGTFISMLFWGIELHRVSLAALMIVMGMIVDNAIVVVDGSLVRLQQGEDRFSSVVKPPLETAWPLLAATAVSCMAFLPIYLSPDSSGEYLGSIFQVVSVSLMISWVLAMSQTPLFCDRFLRIPADKKPGDLFSGKIYRFYGRILDLALRQRALTLLLMTALLLLSIYGFGYVPKMFYADSDKAQFFIDYWLPEGARIQEVSENLKVLEAHLKGLPEVKNFATCIGSGPPRYIFQKNPKLRWPNYGQVLINVYDYRKIKGLVPKLDAWFKEYFPDAEPTVNTYINGPPYDFRVESRFSGPDPRVLRDLADQAKHIMESEPHAKYVRDDWRQRVPKFELVYSQSRGRKTGVERKDVSVAVKSMTDGQPLCFYRENDELIPVLVKTHVTDSSRLSGFENTTVWGSGPNAVPLGQTLRATEVEWEDPIIRRYNGQRAIKAQCESAGVTGDTLFGLIRPQIEAINLPPGYKLEWAGEHELSEDEGKGLKKNLPMILILMAFILVTLFNGFRQPLIIVLVIPLAFIGITAGLLITGLGFGFVSLLGAYSLVGMLIKNAVVLIDRIDIEIRKGSEPLKAVKDSCIMRMRPVLMASVTTIFGMTPLLTDTLFATMSVTIIFGLSFGTILTLIVVPVLYAVFFRIRNIPARND